jgi:hypothetical protein
LFDDLNALDPDTKVQALAAGAGWFERFKVWHGFHNLEPTGEAAGTDVVAAENLPAKFLSVIQEYGYLPQQVFNLYETGLFFKRMPSITFLSMQEKGPGF